MVTRKGQRSKFDCKGRKIEEKSFDVGTRKKRTRVLNREERGEKKKKKKGGEKKMEKRFRVSR